MDYDSDDMAIKYTQVKLYLLSFCVLNAKKWIWRKLKE